MPSISVRDVDQHTLDELKRIAASNGRSLQAELRALLDQFAALPWESRLADYPFSMMPLPRWYTDLAEVRTDFAGLTISQLPRRRSPFRMLREPLPTPLPGSAAVTQRRVSAA
ncbi:hypothetical protein GCM10027404_06630 [Arthrobacter tumbae]|uniref:FitA-like ribbon-helix-helix domain-containing protein n=1 Tax=Arthrobacter tumbae TaxID=163874 RepID=UPI001958D16E|nr:hypothetical protein [Arthrobacter tumbae]MBM7779893.1 hypothetical protein [Arthrobacter tumbae]